jgi:hypothetical protein
MKFLGLAISGGRIDRRVGAAPDHLSLTFASMHTFCRCPHAHLNSLCTVHLATNLSVEISHDSSAQRQGGVRRSSIAQYRRARTATP